jgi:hypothetical protein
VDARRISPTFVSRYTAARHVGPLPESNGVQAAETLVELAHRYRADLVFPTTHQSLFPLLARVGELPEGAAASDVGWPVICKPLMSHEPLSNGSIATRPVTFARSSAALRERWESRAITTPLMIQHYLIGTGVGVDLLCWDGASVAAFQHRRLREVPIWGGMSASPVSEPVDPQLLEFAQRMLEPLSWTGLAMVEFRATPRARCRWRSMDGSGDRSRCR